MNVLGLRTRIRFVRFFEVNWCIHRSTDVKYAEVNRHETHRNKCSLDRFHKGPSVDVFMKKQTQDVAGFSRPCFLSPSTSRLTES